MFFLSVLPFIFKYDISDVLTTSSAWKWDWYYVCNLLVIRLCFKVKNIGDISIFVYNLPHFSLKGLYSLAVKNPNSMITMFACLFLILYDLLIKIVCAQQPLHDGQPIHNSLKANTGHFAQQNFRRSLLAQVWSARTTLSGHFEQ